MSMKRTSTVIARALAFNSINTSRRVCLPSFMCSVHVRHHSLRRRRGSTDSPPSDGSTTVNAASAVNRPVRVMDTLEFVIAAQDLLEKIAKSLEPMKKCIMTTSSFHRNFNKLTLTIGFGDEYSLEIDGDSNTVVMQSPLSGRFNDDIVLVDKELGR
jgi:hypothetical protein